MKKIDRLVVKNFKAFRDQTFEFGGKNVLLYGNNGSGKSSLYWALYTFLQSSGKTDAQLQAYFQHFEEQNPATFRSLKNVFAPTDQDVLVEMTYVEDDGTKTIKTISPALINTIGDAVLQKANLASDFINYKLLQNFYNVTHKQEVNLWEVFWRDVFPYFEENGKSYREQMENLELPLIQENQGNVNTFISDETVVIAGDIAENGPEESPDEVLIENDIIQEQFQLKLETINNEILSFITQIENNANDFLKAHFYEGKDFLKLLLKYKTTIDERWVREKNDALTNNKIPQGAEIKLWVSMYDAQTQQWIENHRPQSFLNKAQLTRIALAIRIGALRTRPPRENIDFRVLCLDDLLISLDMSNRHKVIKMLLNVDNNPALAFFDDY
ncbi:AAA family ATPase [Runella sp.]|uniref:AAA family ATPase n=1 Tax=Runella sp. TaxID=1960881 RepID=UPI0026097F2C|nr:AAA family ATPase [Runella sp.]